MLARTFLEEPVPWTSAASRQRSRVLQKGQAHAIPQPNHSAAGNQANSRRAHRHMSPSLALCPRRLRGRGGRRVHRLPPPVASTVQAPCGDISVAAAAGRRRPRGRRLRLRLLAASPHAGPPRRTSVAGDPRPGRRGRWRARRWPAGRPAGQPGAQGDQPGDRARDFHRCERPSAGGTLRGDHPGQSSMTTVEDHGFVRREDSS